MIVDQHYPVVEKYYGPGKMAYVVAKLMEECDRVTKGLVESWEEERSMKRKVAIAGTILWHSLKLFSYHQLQSVSTSIFAPSQVVRRPAMQRSTLEEDQVDPREIDKVLTELSAMSGRWALFRKFLLDNLTVRGLFEALEFFFISESRTIPQTWTTKNHSPFQACTSQIRNIHLGYHSQKE